MQSSRSYSSGLTLPELVITLLLLSASVALVLPIYADLASRNALYVRQTSLYGALHFARTQALISGVPVVVCPMGEEGGCSQRSADWSRGWLVFNDPDALNDCLPGPSGNTCQHGRGKLLLKTSVPEDVYIATNQNVARRVRFNPLGMSYGYTGRFTFCSHREGVSPLGLVVPQTGRIRRAGPGEWLDCPG